MTPENNHPNLDRVLSQVPAQDREALREVWDMATLGTAGEGEHGEDVWRALEAHTRRGPRMRLVWAGSATAALALAATLLFFFVPVSVTAPAAEMRTVELADGSTVLLNSGSTLRHNRVFLGTRTVRLSGEAFFSVTSSNARFIVRTHDAEVEVLGTEFSVRAWGDERDGGTTVSLVEGRVAFRALDSPETLELAPGEASRITDSGPTPLPVQAALDAPAWRNGDFRYRDVWVSTILADLERRFGIRVQIPVAVSDRRMTLLLTAPASPEAVLDDLTVALGVQYEAVAGGYRLVLP
ncbi:MAG: FecR domain-containing protein [Rhodothermales bacterium]|nr:FecR domain-containing protein [Rhodothermales bacterium]MBO6778047.1 FecR domain-containing protein [Rhodothermales bacterium]